MGRSSGVQGYGGFFPRLQWTLRVFEVSGRSSGVQWDFKVLEVFLGVQLPGDCSMGVQGDGGVFVGVQQAFRRCLVLLRPLCGRSGSGRAFSSGSEGVQCLGRSLERSFSAAMNVNFALLGFTAA